MSEQDKGFTFEGADGERIEGRAIELPPGFGQLLAGLIGGVGQPREEADPDHPLMKRIAEQETLPYRPATKEEFLKFFKGWPELRVGDIVEIREDMQLDRWPAPGMKCIVTQVLKNPRRVGRPFSEEMGRQNDVALMFMENADSEVIAAFAEQEGRAQGQPRIAEFLYDSRRLKKLGSVFDDEE